MATQYGASGHGTSTATEVATRPSATDVLDADWRQAGLVQEAAERELLGMLMDDASLPQHLAQGFLERVAGHLQPGDFYVRLHRDAYAAMLAVAATGVQPDPTLLEAELRRLDAPHTMADLFGLYSRTGDGASPTRLDALARVVREASARRYAALLGAKITAASAEREQDADALLDRMEGAVRAARERYGAGPGGADDTIANVVAEYRKQAAEWRASPFALRGTTTGIRMLDDATRGIHRGDLWLVGARMSGGKTALMLSMALAAARACTPGHQIAIVSLEMRKTAILHRLAAMLSGQSASDIEDGAPWVDWEAFEAALDEAEQLPIRLIDAQGAARRTNGSRGKMTAAEIARHARAWRQAGTLDALYADYLELIKPAKEDEKASRDLQLGNAAIALKALASELDVPLVLLSQLNRESEKTANHIPQLGNIRYSDEPAAAADVVLFPVIWDYWRDRGQDLPKEAQDKPAGVMDLWIAKQRNRAVKMVPAFYLKERMQVVDYDERIGQPVDYHRRPIVRQMVAGR